jgi:hypothetical protein
VSGRLATVTAIAPRHKLPCPHCDVVMQIRHLIVHIDAGECPVLEARRNTKAGA